jgi:hypothetical protein
MFMELPEFPFGCDFQNGHQNAEKLTLPGFQRKLIYRANMM